MFVYATGTPPIKLLSTIVVLLIMSQSESLSLIPLIHVPTSTSSATSSSGSTSKDVSRALVDALRTSGFLLATSPLLTPELQRRALKAASGFLQSKSTPEITSHPTDPKIYAMLDYEKCHDASPILKEYMETMKLIKMDILRHIAMGLELDDESFFETLHSEHNDSLRLINYYPITATEGEGKPEDTGNRCKEHSDYGTITLLSTDGVSGLEVFYEGCWHPVPHVDCGDRAALVVNIGSLLSGWTKGNLLATLHRVAGPASLKSKTPKEDLIKAAKSTRTSIAFFADPNENVSKSLSLRGEQEENLMKGEDGDINILNGMSVSEYIQWRSGGSGDDHDRSGVDFVEVEKKRINRS